MTAKECLRNMIVECGVLEATDPRIVAALKMLRVADDVVNYVCRDHIEGTIYRVGQKMRPQTHDHIILSNVYRFTQIFSLKDSLVNLQLSRIKNPNAFCKIMLLHYFVKHQCQQNKPLTTNQKVL